MNGRLRNTGHSISSRFLERPILVLLLFAVTALFLLTTSLVVVDAHRHHHGHQHHGEGRQRSPYEILGVSRTATEVEIKKAYKALALKWHPDRNPGNEEANQKFAEISNAYEILGDPEKKREYDTYGSVGQQQQHGGYRHFHSSHDFFSNVFREFFGEQWQQQKQEDPLRVTSVKTISEEDYAALMEGTHSMSHRVWVIFIYTFTSTNSRRVIKLVNELEADMGQSIFVRKLEFVYTPSGGGNVKLPRGMDVFPGLVLISPSYGAEMYPFNVYTSDLMKRWIADRLHPSPSKLITSFGPSPSQSSLNEFLNAPTGRGVSAIVFSQRAEIAINEALVAWECKDFIKIGHYRVRSAQQLSSLSGLVELHAHQLPAMVIVDRTMPSKQTMRLITNLDKEKFLGALKTEGLAFGRFPVIRSQSALWDMCHDRTCLLYSRNSSTTAVPVPLRDQIEQELPLDPILSKHKLRLAQVENHEQLCAFFNESLSSSFLFAIVEVSTQHFESMALDNDYTDLNDVKQWIETKMTRGLHSRYSGDIPVERSSSIPLLKFLTPLMRSITKMVNIGVDHLLEAPLLISLMYCFLAVYFMLWVFFWTFSPSPPPPPKKPTSSTSQQLQQRPTHSYNPPARGQ